MECLNPQTILFQDRQQYALSYQEEQQQQPTVIVQNQAEVKVKKRK